MVNPERVYRFNGFRVSGPEEQIRRLKQAKMRAEIKAKFLPIPRHPTKSFLYRTKARWDLIDILVEIQLKKESNTEHLSG